MMPCTRSAFSRVHGTTSSTQFDRADTTSIGVSTPRLSASRTSDTSAAVATGLWMYCWACCRIARSSVSGASSDVITTTRGRVFTRFRWSSTPRPSMRGIQTSSSIRSNLFARRRRSASTPSLATRTVNPAFISATRAT